MQVTQKKSSIFFDTETSKLFQWIDNASQFKEMYKETKDIGCGNFGEVKAMKHIKSGIERAVKIVKKQYIMNKGETDIKNMR